MNFSQQLQDYQKAVESALDEYLSVRDFPQREGLDAMRYSLLGGGKRVRAVLVLAFAGAFGVDARQAMPFAAALEMVHAYSLIHDDLPCMDDDDFRRGKPSCHRQFSEATAVLAGDGLLTHAFLTLLREGIAVGVPAEKVVAAGTLLAQRAGLDGMLGGQIIDLSIEGKTVERSLHQEMCELKTGALIRAACVIGSVLGNASKEQMNIVDKYAQKIGLSFQIIDDILDCVGQQELLGKPIGSDAAQHKTTYVTLYGLEQAKELSRQLTAQALDCLDQLSLPDDFLYDLTRMLLERRF